MEPSEKRSRSWIMACVAVVLSAAALSIALSGYAKADSVASRHGILTPEELRIARSIIYAQALRYEWGWGSDHMMYDSKNPPPYAQRALEIEDRLASYGEDAVFGVRMLTDYRGGAPTNLMERLDPSTSWLKDAYMEVLRGERPFAQRRVLDTKKDAADWLIKHHPVVALRYAPRVARNIFTQELALKMLRRLRKTGIGVDDNEYGDDSDYRNTLARIMENKQSYVHNRVAAASLAGEWNMQKLLPGLIYMLDDERDTGWKEWWEKDPWWKGFTPPTPAGVEPVTVRVNDVAIWSIQKLTGEDFGYTSCRESRKNMPKIVKRIREHYPEIMQELAAEEERMKMDNQDGRPITYLALHRVMNSLENQRREKEWEEKKKVGTHD